MPLILVATPIGNLGDLPPRAAAALAEADCICCEDTRRTGRLLQLAGIERKAPLVRVDDHTEAARIPQLLDRVRRGERVVVVTDARTLADLAAALGADRRVAVGRELTKLHEEVRRSTLAEAAAWAAAKEPVGE